MGDTEFRVLSPAGDDLQESVVAFLLAHNLRHNSIFFHARELPEHAAKPLHVIAFDVQGVVVGGLFAETQFAWLKVSIMAVAESARGRGIGRRLLERAEQEAMGRGCRYVFLDTMSYQAPGFYRKLGYQQAGQIDDWDSHGHSKFFFTKRLGGV